MSEVIGRQLALRVFDFGDQAVRILNRAGEPWFVAADVCRVLELGNPSMAAQGLDEDEKITLSNPEGNPRGGIPRQYVLISESGLYALIFKSRKPQARAFRKWVTQEVLPQIRETGAYYGPLRDIDERETERAKLRAMREEATRQLEELQEMTDYALHGALNGRMRLSQAKVISALVGHRMGMLRIRMDLWAPERGSVDDCPQSGTLLGDREREDLVALTEAIWQDGEEMDAFATWLGVARSRGLFPWLLGEGGSEAGDRSSLGKLLRRWEGRKLGNGLTFRLLKRGRRLLVELRPERGRTGTALPPAGKEAA